LTTIVKKMDEAPIRTLVIDDDDAVLTAFRMALKRENHQVATASSGVEALALAHEQEFDIAILDLKMPGMDGLEVLRRLKGIAPSTSVIILTGHGTLDGAVQAMKDGAYDFIQKPVNPVDLIDLIRRAADERRLIATARQITGTPLQRPSLRQIVGVSNGIRRVISLIARAGPMDSPVLIEGESGTGKELVARALHAASSRRDRRFLVADCSAIPETDVPEKLFGVVRGEDKTPGLVEAANGGSLLIDEIACLNNAMQVAILRMLEDRQILRVGSATPIPVDLRVLATISLDAGEAVRGGRLREDLFYRLGVFTVSIPPLRERAEDIPLLAGHKLGLLAQRYGSSKPDLSDEAQAILKDYSWPGNVRELENVVERAFALDDDGVIGADDLTLRVLAEEPKFELAELEADYSSAKQTVLHEFHKHFIRRALEANDGNVARTAEQIGLGRTVLHRLMKRYGIQSDRGG